MAPVIIGILICGVILLYFASLYMYIRSLTFPSVITT